MLILSSVLVLGILGLIFGIILAYASKKISVEVDERVEVILEILPGANCGGCGFPGCGALANAIVEGKATVNACPVGGVDCASKIGDIMGISSKGGEKQVAKVLCKGNCKSAKDKYKYEGIQDCRSASMLNSGPKDCKFGCLGLGTCKEYCKFDAISVIDGVAIIDEEKCVMCGKCIEVCPKFIIGRKPASKEVVVECSSKDFGKTVKEKCSVGCIGCGLCKKACLFGAIEFENKIAKINYEKCVECMECVRKCTTKVIKGELKENHSVDESKCVGCHLCIQKCPKKAIKTI